MTITRILTVLALGALLMLCPHQMAVVLVAVVTHLPTVVVIAVPAGIAGTIAVLLARIACVIGETGGWRLAPWKAEFA